MVERVSANGHLVAPTSLRRLLLALLTTAAILLGLIGMHALSAGADTQSSHSSHSQLASGLASGLVSGQGSPQQIMAASADSDPLAVASAIILSAGVAPAEGCTGMCATNCLLLGMVCALSLLVALTGVVSGKLPSRVLRGIQTPTRVARIVGSKFVLPTTASLHMLSISRT